KQKGGYRQFVQFDIEANGIDDPLIDVGVLSMLMHIYHSFRLKYQKLHITSHGDQVSHRPYNEALVDHFRPSITEFCTDCQTRIDTNPMRILDCKKDRDHELIKTAPRMYDYLNEESKTYFEEVKSNLDAIGIGYEIDYNLVRG